MAALTRLTRLGVLDKSRCRPALLLPRALPQLLTLEIGHGWRSQAASQATMHVLRRYPTLTHLDLNGCGIGDPETTPWLPALWRSTLATLTSLRVLRMQHCHIHTRWRKRLLWRPC